MATDALATEGAARSVWDAQHRALTAGMLMIITAVGFEALAVATALPVAAKELGGLRLYGWAFSAFLLTSLVSSVAGSRWADRVGPARPLSVTIGFFTLGLLVAGFAPNMPVFIVGRALQGAGAGTISALAYLSISRGYADELRARMLALISTAWVLPSLVGPAIAGYLSEQWSWRWAVLGLLPLPLIAAAMLLPPLRQLGAPPQSAGESRLRAALQLAVGTGVALGGASITTVPLALATVAAGIAIALPALRTVLPPGTLTARRGLPAGLAARGLLTFAFFGAEAYIPLGLTVMRGLTATEAGLVLTVSGLTWTAGAWIQERLDGRYAGQRRLRVVAGFAGVSLGIALSGAILQLPALSPWLVLPVWCITGLGMGLAYASVSLITMAAAPSGSEGAVSGSLAVAETLSTAVSAGLGGAAVSIGAALDWPARVGIGIAFALALAGGLLGMATARRMSG